VNSIDFDIFVFVLKMGMIESFSLFRPCVDVNWFERLFLNTDGISSTFVV